MPITDKYGEVLNLRDTVYFGENDFTGTIIAFYLETDGELIAVVEAGGDIGFDVPVRLLSKVV